MLPSKGDNASDSGVGSSSDDNPGPATDQSMYSNPKKI
jgi:hypothetical protein